MSSTRYRLTLLALQAPAGSTADRQLSWHGQPASYRLKLLLKRALRDYGLVCEAVEEVGEDAERRTRAG